MATARFVPAEWPRPARKVEAAVLGRGLHPRLGGRWQSEAW